MSYRVRMGDMQDNAKVMVVGCGGTGGFVAEGLCQLLGKGDDPVLLIDHDRVEPHNLRRQNFFRGDVGKYKSQVLAERLSRQYGRKIAYTIYPFDPDMIREDLGGGFYREALHGLIIGCVDDSTPARRIISESLRYGNWWIDAGNGRHSGQVLIGNITSVESLKEGFDEKEQIVTRLPAPSLQLPSLLVPSTVPEEEQRDCAEEVEIDQQSPVINKAMATVVLEYIYGLMKQTLTWMGTYIDLETGTRSNVPADPVTVARMCKVKVDTLMTKTLCEKAGYEKKRSRNR